MALLSENRFKEILGQFSQIDPLLVVGDVGVDKYTYGSVKRISPEAPVPVLEVEHEWYQLGLAANVANNLHGLEVKCTLCGVIGDDRNGTLFEDLLDDYDIKTWGLIREKKRPTTYKERVTTNSQQICRIDYETKQNISLDAQERLLKRAFDFIDDHGAVIIQDYDKGLVTARMASDLIKKFKNAGRIVAVDPSRGTPPEFYKGATLLKPNLIEAERMVTALGYPEMKLEQMANVLVDKLSLTQLVITLGSEGMAILDTQSDGKLIKIPTMANEVFDVSGAGDTAISVIVASLATGASLTEAAWMGNCASGVVVAKKGTATTTQTELLNFYQFLRQKMQPHGQAL